MTLVEIENVTRRFGGLVAVDAVTTKEDAMNGDVAFPFTRHPLSIANPAGKVPDVTEQEVIGPPEDTTL